MVETSGKAATFSQVPRPLEIRSSSVKPPAKLVAWESGSTQDTATDFACETVPSKRPVGNTLINPSRVLSWKGQDTDADFDRYAKYHSRFHSGFQGSGSGEG